MPRVEFHCHTSFSRDCLLSPRDLLRCCVRKGIDRVVITDHNGILGARQAQALDPGRVIVGEEIMTTRGEMLAIFVTSQVLPGLSPDETVSRLRDQSAFIIIPHPFDRFRKGSWTPNHLLEVIPLVDAIETYNSRCMLPAHNRLASEFCRRHQLAATVGSDAHTCWELGRSTLLLPVFNNAQELREVIRQGQAVTHWSPPWTHLSSRYALLRRQMRRPLDTA